MSHLQSTDEEASNPESSITAFLLALDLLDCLNLDDLLRRVELLRGRRIVLQKLRTTDTQLTGLWVQAAHVDKILVRSNLSALNRLHVILHGCGHMILRHRGCTGVFAGPSSSVINETGIEARERLGDQIRSVEEEAATESFAHRLGPYFLHRVVLAGSEFEAAFE